MAKGWRFIAAMMTAAVITGLPEGRAGTEDSMECIKTWLTVENLSNRTVRVSELRWLNSAGDTWFAKPADSGDLAAGDEWQTEFCITGVDGGSTFISINYDILLDDPAQTWSRDHLGKQVHVLLDREPVKARLDIARRNLRLSP